MRRARTRRRAAAVAVAAGVSLLGACGIPETDVIEAGGPATVQGSFKRDSHMLLFFRFPDGGLAPVLRTTVPPVGFDDAYVESGAEGQNVDTLTGPPAPEKVVFALLAGPRAEDLAVGLGTALPTVPRGATIEFATSATGEVTTRLPIPLNGLDDTALRQLTCTIAYSHDPDGRITVQLRGQDGTSTTDTCGLAPGDIGNVPTPTGAE